MNRRGISGENGRRHGGQLGEKSNKMEKNGIKKAKIIRSGMAAWQHRQK